MMALKKDMQAELDELRAKVEEYEDDEEPSPDPNGYYVPTAIHIPLPPEGPGLSTMDEFRYYCSFWQEGSWEAEWMEDEKARTLPTCPECILLWEMKNGRKWGTPSPNAKPAPQPVSVRKQPETPFPWLYKQGLTLSDVPIA